jgi:DNA primase
MLTEDSVREAIDTARIEDVVGDFVNLRRRGNNYSGLCPFHNEKTPSFNVNPARNIYKCFGCGVGGDPVKFLMELEQLSFVDAVKWIARKYNLKLEEKELSQEVKEERQERESLLITNDFARKYFEEQLHQTDEGKSVGLSYFRQRGFLEDTLRTFGLGYAPARGNGLLRAATAAGYGEQQLEKLGLARNGRDFFYDRVMFTIHNLSGKPIAFAGRILRRDARAPKYVNSPETEIYHKSDVLYGVYQARQSIRKQDAVYLVEGYTDVISLHQNGIKNVAATSGTSLTEGQARLLKRLTENVTLLYDGDKAGIKAALRGVDVLLTADLNVNVVVLPEGQDPDSYLQEVGSTRFQEYLDQTSRDFLFFKADLLLTEAGTQVGERTKAIRDIGSTLALVSDPIKRATYVQQFSQRLGIEESLLVNLVNTAIGERRNEQRKAEQREARRRERENRQRPAGGADWGDLEEPGWVTSSDDEAAFPDDMPQPDAGKAPADALLTGHAFQERYLLELLIRDGQKLYDEEQQITVAAYLTANVSDILDDFDIPEYRETIQSIQNEMTRRGAPPGREWYNLHKNPAIRELAAEAHQRTYTYSPNWKEKYNLHLNQKWPEDNHRLTAEIFIRILRMEKITRKRDANARKIADLEKVGDWTAVVKHAKLQTLLDKLRADLASELGTVVLSR